MAEEAGCPLCGFEQDDPCVVGDDGLGYACENDGCRVSVFNRVPPIQNEEITREGGDDGNR